MGETERHIFEGALIVGAALWIFVSAFTTRRLLEAWFAAHGRRVPFIAASSILSVSHIVVSLLYVAVLWWADVTLVHIAVWSIAIAPILQALVYLYLGWATRPVRR